MQFRSRASCPTSSRELALVLTLKSPRLQASAARVIWRKGRRILRDPNIPEKIPSEEDAQPFDGQCNQGLPIQDVNSGRSLRTLERGLNYRLGLRVPE